MQIAFHLGAHCTDEGALLRVLLRNKALLLEQGIAIPDPSRYPALLQAAASLYAGRAAPTTPEELIEALLPLEEEDGAERMVLSFDAFLAFQRDAVTESQLYPAAARRVSGLRSLFPKSRVEFLIALRNPATFLPSLSAKRVQKGLPPLPEGFEATGLRWSELIGRLRAACPDAPLTVWCDEDAPVLWSKILRATAGCADEALEFTGVLDFPARLLSPQNAQRLLQAYQNAAPQTDAARAITLSQFLSKYAEDDLMEMSFEMPNWTEQTLIELTEAYELDCAEIAQMDGITFLR